MDQQLWDRFEKVYAQSMIDASGCRIWAGHISTLGYPILTRRHDGPRGKAQKYRVHRLSYLRFNGAIPDGLLVRHLCNVRKCVNPEHLAVGTTQDNIDDKTRAGNQPVGEKNPKARLNEKQVSIIRRLIRRGARTGVIARIYGISDSVVSDIRYNRIWRHVS